MSENIVILFFLVSFMITTLLSLWSGQVLIKRLDRYRLKYGFDKEIEAKDINSKPEEPLAKREKEYKKRVFKD